MQGKLPYFLPTVGHFQVSTQNLSGLTTALCQVPPTKHRNIYAMVIPSILKPVYNLINYSQESKSPEHSVTALLSRVFPAPSHVPGPVILSCSLLHCWPFIAVFQSKCETHTMLSSC